MKKTFLYAFRRSLPIFISWVPVALAYGVLMESAGYNFIWTGLTSIAVYAGSLQFLMVSFLTGSASYLTVMVMALLLNSRHIFYGLPYIEKFRRFGGWKYYLIYALTDECFSLYCSKDFGKGVNEKWAYIMNSTPLVFQYTLLSNKWGAVQNERMCRLLTYERQKLTVSGAAVKEENTAVAFSK